MPSRDSHRRAAVAALFVTVLWSSSWVIIRYGIADEELPPLTFAGLRYAAAALVLGAAVAARPAARREVRTMPPGLLRRLALLGVVFYAVTQGAQFIAIEAQPVATTSLVLSLTPLLVTGVSGRLLGEPPGANLLAGAVLVPIGAAAYLSGDLGATATGIVAAVIAVIANATASLLGRSVNRSARSTPMVTTAVSMAIGAAVLLACGLAVDGVVDISWRAVAIVTWLAVVNTAVAFTLWNRSLRHLGAGESAVINNTMLLQIALLGWLFLDETPTPLQWVGLAVVSAGIAISQLRGRPAGTRFVRLAPVDADGDWDGVMEAAIAEAERAVGHDDVPVGAVVVRDGKVIAARHNERELTGDPTAHAEILAIRDAAAVVGHWRLDDCTVVVTLEPCPMCAGAMVNARVGRLVYGATDPKAGATGSLMNLVADPRLNHRVQVISGVQADRCGALLVEFFAARR
jgi:tRNA(Arg) A34 adenosine deaminase TadA/drug/metabolite transporter (DMT)-like permease